MIQPDLSKDTFAKLITLSRSVQPDQGDNGWYIHVDLLRAFESVKRESIPGWPEDDWSRAHDLKLFRPWTLADTDPLNDAIMRAMQAAYEQAGLFELAAQLAAAPRAVRPFEAWDDILLAYDFGDLFAVRELASTLIGRMHMAALDADMQRLTRSFEQALAVGRVNQCQPFLLQYLTGSAISTAACTELMHLLCEYDFDEDLCRELLSALNRQQTRATVKLAIECERLGLLDIIDRVFSDDGNGDGVLQPRLLAALNSEHHFDATGTIRKYIKTLEENPDRQVPTRREVTSDINAYIDALVDIATTPPHLREELLSTLDAAWEKIESRHPYFVPFVPAIYRSITTDDRHKATRDAMRLAIAIEMFEARHGNVPDTLDKLVPQMLDALPVDSISGLPFVYKPVPRSQWTKEDPRHYLLYSIGADGIDDNGPRSSPIR